MNEELSIPFGAFIEALKTKDAELFAKLGHLSAGEFWRRWKEVYPEDFPQGGLSPANASSVIPRQR